MHAPSALLASPALQTSTKLIACALWRLGPPAAERVKGDPVFVWPGVPRLCEMSALSMRTAHRALAQLADAGWIKRSIGRNSYGHAALGWLRFEEPRVVLRALDGGCASSATHPSSSAPPGDNPVDNLWSEAGAGVSPVAHPATGDDPIVTSGTDPCHPRQTERGEGETKQRGAHGSPGRASSRPTRPGPADAQTEIDFNLAAAAAFAVVRFLPARPGRPGRPGAGVAPPARSLPATGPGAPGLDSGAPGGPAAHGATEGPARETGPPPCGEGPAGAVVVAFGP